MATVITLTAEICLSDQDTALPPHELDTFTERVRRTLETHLPGDVGRVAYVTTERTDQFVNPRT